MALLTSWSGNWHYAGGIHQGHFSFGLAVSWNCVLLCIMLMLHASCIMHHASCFTHRHLSFFTLKTTIPFVLKRPFRGLSWMFNFLNQSMLKAMASQSGHWSTCSVPMLSTRPHRRQHRWAMKTGLIFGDSTRTGLFVWIKKACSRVQPRSTPFLIHSQNCSFHSGPRVFSLKRKARLEEPLTGRPSWSV